MKNWKENDLAFFASIVYTMYIMRKSQFNAEMNFCLYCKVKVQYTILL